MEKWKSLVTRMSNQGQDLGGYWSLYGWSVYINLIVEEGFGNYDDQKLKTETSF